WSQELLDIAAEQLAVDRAINHARRRDAVVAQGGDEGAGLPMPMRDARHQPLPTRGAAMGPGQGRRRPGLVDKHQPLSRQARLPFPPGYARSGDVGAVLLAGVERLFFSRRSWLSKNRQTVP